jgi:hypothetical protein
MNQVASHVLAQEPGSLVECLRAGGRVRLVQLGPAWFALAVFALVSRDSGTLIIRGGTSSCGRVQMSGAEGRQNRACARPGCLSPQLWRRMQTVLLWGRSVVHQSLSRQAGTPAWNASSPRLAAKVGRAGRVRALAHHEPGPTVVVVELPRGFDAQAPA